MRILHLNNSDTGGGAAIAARRIHNALCSQEIDSNLAVFNNSLGTKKSLGLSSRLHRALHPWLLGLERLPLCLTQHNKSTLFSPSWLPIHLHHYINHLGADILHLHWIADNFLSPFALKRLTKPVVWTLHDKWPLTGGCHILQGCQRFRECCGHCPQLGSSSRYDLSYWCHIYKASAYRKLKPVIVAPSRYMAKLASESSLLGNCRIEIIPNGIDTQIFRPVPKATARELLGLPQNSKLLLFGAVNAMSDVNKGFDLLCATLQSLHRLTSIPVTCVVFGAFNGSTESIPYPVNFLGKLHDDIALSLSYAAADVFICPSREENLPNCVLEAMACGTPVVCFSMGGMPDLIDHEESGWLASPWDADDLAIGLHRLLENDEHRAKIGEKAREAAVERFEVSAIVHRYINLYEDLLQSPIS